MLTPFHTNRPLRSACPTLLAVLCLVLTACEEDDGASAIDDEHEHEREHEHEHDESHDKADAETQGPLYVVATSFSAGDEMETYLVTTDSWDEDTKLDPTDGPSLVGGVVPVVHAGAVYVADGASPVITRYDVNAEDKLEKGDSLSFAGVGMTKIMSWHVYIVNDKTGYVFDPAGPRIVVWDPSSMSLTGDEIDLSEIERDGWTPNLTLEHSGPHQRGDTLLIPLGWQDQDGNSRYASGLLAIDTRQHSVISVDEDERCGETYAVVEAPGGDLYFFPPDWSSAQHFFAEAHEPTCVSRVPAGETKFDPGEPLNLSKLGSGAAAAGAVPDGQGGFFFTSADAALWKEREDNDETFWRFWHYDFASQESREIDSMPTWAGQGYYVNVGGELFIPYWIETDTGYRTTLYRVQGADDPSPLFSFDANWYGMAKLR